MSNRNVKEDKDCTVCTDFKDWMKNTTTGKSKQENKSKRVEQASKSVVDDCPLYRDQLGRATWSLLHTMAAYYPEKASEQEQTSMKSFINSFSMFFPCHECAKDFRDELVSFCIIFSFPFHFIKSLIKSI